MLAGMEPAWMGKPYSLDLRKRVVAAVLTGGMSRNQAALHFGVGISTAINWVKRQQETGSVAPGKMGGHRPKAISGEHRLWVLQRTKGGDFTLRGLVAELAAERGLEGRLPLGVGVCPRREAELQKKRGGWRTRSSGRRAAAGAVDRVSKSRRA
jgi:transposase